MLSQKQIWPPNSIYGMSYRDIYVGWMCMYETTGVHHVTKRTEPIHCKLHFMVLAYITGQVWLPHCKCKSHCPHSVWADKCDICACIDVKAQSTAKSTLHVIVLYLPETNMVTKLHIYATYLRNIDGHIFGQMYHI